MTNSNSKFTAHLSLVVAFILFSACSESKGEEQAATTVCTVCSCGVVKSAPVKIIFDTDMGSDCDDVGALALLHKYAAEGKAEILACIFSSGKVPYGAGIIDAINVYYGRGDIPVGAYQGDIVGDPVDKMNAEIIAKDTATYGNTIVHNSDAEDQTRVSRRLLVAQPDASVTYVTVGHTKGLYELLISEPDDISELHGFDLVAKKVDRWVALGALRSYNRSEFVRDWNFFFNGTAPYTEYLVQNFPSAAYFVDAGNEVMTGKSLKDTPEGNIVRTTYTEWLKKVFDYTLDDQRPSWDLAAVHYAVVGLGKFLVNKGQGLMEYDKDAGAKWTTGKGSKEHYYIDQIEGTDEPFAEYLNASIALSPEYLQSLNDEA